MAGYTNRATQLQLRTTDINHENPFQPCCPTIFPISLAATSGHTAGTGTDMDAHSLGAGMIHLQNLTVCYRRHPAIHHICGAFNHGSHTAIVGPNGAGKTTLLKALVGLLPSTGTIEISDQIAYLPQLTELDRQFPITVEELVLSGCWRKYGNWNKLDHPSQQKTQAALHRLGLEDFAARPVSMLSGGQLQRARFARLMVQDAPIILLDEPFNSIDSKTTQNLLALLEEWHVAGKTLVTVVHDLNMARMHFPQTLLLAREVIAWGETANILTPDNLSRAQATTEHWQEQTEWCERP